MTRQDYIAPIIEAIEKRGMSQAVLAERAQLNQKTVNNLLSGRTKKIDMGIVSKLWEALDMGAPRKDQVSEVEFVRLPRYEVQASAGGGALVTSEQIVDYLYFKPEWLKSTKGVLPGNLVMISVIGDSMEPTLADGDLIAVDITEGRFKSDAVYVLQQGDRLLVKRLQFKIDGTVLVKSDNSAKYEPEIFRGDELDNLKIIGRVVWRGGDL